MLILINILIILAFAGFFSGLFMLWRIPFCVNRSKSEKAEKLSVIIPARNEEKNLPFLLRSLLEQDFKPSEIIVVNDNSTDKTKETALGFGVKVIDSKPLPKGWTGKNWACYQGFMVSKEDILLFLDADTYLEAGGLLKLINTFVSKNSVVSLCPYHKIEKFYENFSVFFNIIMLAGINAFTFRGNASKQKGLFGQCMILSRQDYLKAGGHESVKGRILENFFLSKVFNKKGIEINCYGGRDAISMRMFPEGLSQLIRGWSKAFASGAGNTPPAVFFSVILWLSGGIIAFVLPFYFFVAQYPFGLALLTVSLYLLYVFQTIWMSRRIGSYSIATALFYPVYSLFYNAVFAKSLLSLIFKKEVKWKDRDVLENS